MRTLIKTSFVAIALLLGINASAQDKPLTFGVKAGVNISNFNGGLKNTDAKVGFNVGATLDYAFTPDLYLLTGLSLTSKGAKIKYAETNHTSSKETWNPIYLQIPAHIGYKVAVGGNTKIVLHAGPYFSYGVGGKISSENKITVGPIIGDLGGKVDFFGEHAYKRFDCGLGFGVAAEFGKIVVDLSYDLGLASISRSNNYKVRNTNGYLSLGYKF